MNALAPDQLAEATNGTWLQPLRQRVLPRGVGIDTREELDGRVFFAIRGEQHDGNAFLDRAVDAGAVVVVVDRPPDTMPVDAGVLQVADTRAALGELARAYRRTLKRTVVIAVTGSAGKTTTKSMIDAVLSTTLTGSCARKSFNNDIGVPLTILNASPEDHYLIVEVGTNAPGEIDVLSAIVQPDIAIITMIGRSHLAGLGTVEAVGAEKRSILNHLTADGTAIVHADSPQLADADAPQRITFGMRDGASLQLTDRGRSDDCWWLEINGEARFELSLPGEHNAVNALAAIALGRKLGLDDSQISSGLSRVSAEAMRFVPEQWRGVQVYNDAYNANPDSMIAALQTFAELTVDAPRRVVILGDMLELGEQSVPLHVQIGQHIARLHRQCPLSHVVLVGPLAAHMAQALDVQTLQLPELTDAAVATIHDLLQPGDAVLIKGSRGCRLERILSSD